MSNELPRGWSLATLSEVAEINPRAFTAPPSDSDLVSFVPMAAVEEESGRLDPTTHREWSEVKKGYTPFQDDDVLFAKVTPCMENGKAALAARLLGGRGVGSTEFFVLRTKGGVTPKFLMHFVLQSSFRRSARAAMQGVAGLLRVRREFMESAQIPVAPLREQQRIVEEIERQFTRLDAGVAALKRVQAQLKRYRASVLKAACEGRLVPTEAELARREKRDYEPADKLLERILKERRARWEADQLAKMTAAGKTPKDDKWKAKYEEPSPPSLDALPTLPAGWSWTTLRTIAELKGGITKGQRRSPEERLVSVPYLRVANVQRGFLELSEMKEIEATDEDVADLKLVRGDILFNEGGDRDKLGRGWIWQEELPLCIHQNHVFRARLYSSDVEPKFVSHYANSLGQQYFIEQGKQTTNLASINLTKLGNLPVPLPPVQEQRRIVSEIDDRLSVADAAMSAVSKSSRRAEILRRGVLGAAFAGLLVRQDPSDEPASKLLERLRHAASSEPALSKRPSKTSAKKASP